jgi:hypothetical protein
MSLVVVAVEDIPTNKVALDLLILMVHMLELEILAILIVIMLQVQVLTLDLVAVDVILQVQFQEMVGMVVPVLS